MNDKNLNTLDYWDSRFASGDWSRKGGRSQTEGFALAQLPWINLPVSFAGTLIDFGCGLGDAMPVYRAQFPSARLIGVDLAPAAIEQCRERFGTLAEFVAGDRTAVPHADVIVTSNVLEHLSDHLEVTRTLAGQCRELYVTVPYRERLNPDWGEHVNTYDETTFAELGGRPVATFACPGWSQYGRELWVEIRLKNLLRLIADRPRRRRDLQIMYRFARQAST